jgi:hypothetical protein
MDNKKGGGQVIFCPAGEKKKQREKAAEAAVIPHRHWVEIL